MFQDAGRIRQRRRYARDTAGWVAAAGRGNARRATGQAGPAQLPDVIARVNGEDVGKTEFDRAVAALEARNGGPVPAGQRDQILRGVLDQIVSYKLLVQESRARKIAAADAEVDARMKEIQGQFPSEEAFKQMLTSRKTTLEQVRADIRQDISVQKVIENEVSAKSAVKPEQVADFYAKNPDQFQQPERVRASHILISVPKGADAAAKTQARTKAADILKDVKAGKDFAALAKEHSQDPGSAQNGGDLGFFQQGQMVGPFNDVAFALKPGAVSDLVETRLRLPHHQSRREAGAAHGADRRGPPSAGAVPRAHEPRTADRRVRQRTQSEGQDRNPDLVVNDPVRDSVRLDVWLDVACLFKTRSEAKRACEGGKVDVNGGSAKPNRALREGDRIRITRGQGRYQDVIVRIVHRAAREEVGSARALRRHHAQAHARRDRSQARRPRVSGRGPRRRHARSAAPPRAPSYQRARLNNGH